MEDKLVLGGKEFNSRFILGSGKYNINLIKAAVEQGGAEIITLALRRANTQEKENILDHIPEGVTLLPNTSGARNAEEAVRIARLSRAMGCGDFVKVEIMRDTKYLFPDNYETVKATEILAKEGFIVLPYMDPDLNVARDLQSAGAAAVMPLAAPIGSNKGLATKAMIQVLIDEIDLPIIVDAGIGKPSQPVRQWKWVLRQLWQILLLQQPGMCLPWQMLLSWLLKQEEKLTLQEWEESWQEAAVHLTRLQDFYVRRRQI